MRAFMIPLEKSIDLIGAEIGVAGGDNAWNILNVLNIKKLHLVDHYREYLDQESGGFVNQENQDNMRRMAQERLEAYSKKCVWHITSSVEAAEEVEDKSLDFVYIDADHGFASVLTDIRCWYSKVKKGGLVAGHDMSNKEVMRAVEAFVNKYEGLIVIKECEDWYFRK